MNPALPDSVSGNLDVVFQKGDNYELKLNLFTPKNSDKALPLVVMVHGGCWIDGGRVDYNYYGVKLAQLGYAAATVDYRVADQAPYPAAVDDVRNTIQWLKDKANTYNIDPDRIALLGGSAGGHLVELIGYAANTPTELHPTGPGPKLKAIVAFYGWSDLTDPTVRDFYWNEAFLGKRVNVLRDDADLQVFLRSHLAWLGREVRIGCPRLDRRLYGQGFQEGSSRRGHWVRHPCVRETNHMFFTGVPFEVVEVGQVIGRPSRYHVVLLEEVDLPLAPFHRLQAISLYAKDRIAPRSLRFAEQEVAHVHAVDLPVVWDLGSRRQH
jgi:acetyl esterase/lipase